MDSLLNNDTDITEWLNILIRNPETAEQDLSALSIKLQLIEQDLELNLDYQSYSLHTVIQSLHSEIESIHRQTIDLISESHQISKTLSFIYSPEIVQLQSDHEALSKISNSKSILQEIDQLDYKLSKALEITKSNTTESITLVSHLFKILQKVENIKNYASYKDRILEILENFDETLTELCFEACKGNNLSQLKKIRAGFESFNSSKFNELVYLCRFEALPCELFHCTVESFDSLSKLVYNEILVIKEVATDPDGLLLKFIHNYLNKINFLQGFDALEVQETSKIFSAFLSFSQMIKENLGNTSCLEDFLAPFNSRVKAEENYLKSIQRIFTRPVTLNSWAFESRNLIKKLEESWDRSLKVSFGTCGVDWAKTAEEVISEQIKVLNLNYSDITNVAVDLLSEDKGKFQWTNSNKFICVFEEILAIYSDLEELSVKCRSSYLQNMTTSYFSPQLEINKEIQASLLKISPGLARNSAGFISFLREGGVFFSKSLENIEKELEICRGYTEKILMNGISQEVTSYSELENFKAADCLFSVSPSPSITKCGDHVLEILQFITPKNESIYVKAFQIVFSTRPPSELPHSLSLHFWIMCFVSRLLKLLILRITKIQNITSQGKKQLLADTEYLFNIINTLGLFKQDEISFGQSLVILRQKLLNNQIDDLSKLKNYL